MFNPIQDRSSGEFIGYNFNFINNASILYSKKDGYMSYKGDKHLGRIDINDDAKKFESDIKNFNTFLENQVSMSFDSFFSGILHDFPKIEEQRVKRTRTKSKQNENESGL